MKKFERLMKMYLTEFNIEDSNDPGFYDYVVLLLQQLVARDLISPEILGDLRKTAMKIVHDKTYNYSDFDNQHNVNCTIDFIFNSFEHGETDNQKLTGMTVVIQNNIPDKNGEKSKPYKITNTFEESSVDDICNHIDDLKSGKNNEEEIPGETAPEAVGETPSAMPGAVPSVPTGEEVPVPPAASTSQYLKGLK